MIRGAKVGERYWLAGPFLLYGYINTGRASAIEVEVTEAYEDCGVDSAGGESVRCKPVRPEEFVPAHGDMLVSTSQFYKTRPEGVRHQLGQLKEFRQKAVDDKESARVLRGFDKHIEELSYELSLVEEIEELQAKERAKNG